MEHCAERIGDAYFRTPRKTITAFLDLLAVLEQNPGTDWPDLLGAVEVSADDGDRRPTWRSRTTTDELAPLRRR